MNVRLLNPSARLLRSGIVEFCYGLFLLTIYCLGRSNNIGFCHDPLVQEKLPQDKQIQAEVNSSLDLTFKGRLNLLVCKFVGVVGHPRSLSLSVMRAIPQSPTRDP